MECIQRQKPFTTKLGPALSRYQNISFLTSHFYLYIDGEYCPNGQLLKVANFFVRQSPKLNANHEDLASSGQY
jgi:hypothetical protein